MADAIATQPVTVTSDKLLGLEALRFVAAFAVLIWHYRHFAYVGGGPVDLVLDQLPLYGLFQPFYEAGRAGVWVFWCISGFIFFWRYRDGIAQRAMPGWTFFVLRLSRLYPLHVVTLLAVAALQAVYFRQHGFFFVYQNNDVFHFILQIFMASKWGFEVDDSFNGPIWSISVEVLVYIAFFILLRFGTRSALLNIVVILLCLNMHGPFFSCLGFFYAGGLAAIARQAIADQRFRGVIETASWIVAAAGPILLWIDGVELQDVGWLFFMTWTPVLLFCSARRMRLPAFAQRLLEAAGNTTYSSYLLHFPLQLLIVIGFTLSGYRIPYDETWFFALFVTSTLLASHLAYRYFEAPAQAFIRRTMLAKAGASGAPTILPTPP